MARRSARLQKPTPTPDRMIRAGSNESWETAQSEQEHDQLLDLPSVAELPEPVNKTPQKSTADAPRTIPRLPVARAPGAQTPSGKSTSAKLLAAASAARTPTNRTPIKPTGDEMHPALHHASTAKPLDEARWLGFQSLGAHTAPPKAAGHAPGTPSKTPAPASKGNAAISGSSPSGFRFQFKSPFSKVAETSKLGELSPTTRNILKEPAIAATPGRAIFGANEFTTKADVTPARKKADAKGKMARFSDIHMAQFKKMDSVANHPSAWRMKKTPSKPDLAAPEPSKLKRTQSKMDLAESSSKSAATPKRTQSTIDLTGSSLPRSQSTVRLVASQEGSNNPAPKRVKRTEVDDAATTRPTSRDGNAEASSSKLPVPPRKITSQTALPRLAARLMTPTKSSLARTGSQTVKATKTTSMIPQSPSARNLFSPAHISRSLRDGARESMLQAKRNLQQVRSILRTPSRKFSDDPAKIAAGTHMSPPPESAWDMAPPMIPATAPVKKHVNFSSSTIGRAEPDDVTKSPSPMKFRAGSEVPSGAVVYPSLGGLNYPKLPQGDASPTSSPARRLTFGDETASQPRSFSFESGKPVNFGPTTTGTIRMVRKSDAPSVVQNTKRKLETLKESSEDKENDDRLENPRSAKKARPTPTPSTPAKATASASKTPRRTPGSAMSKSRLAFLATPKRTKA
ncbi:hypothetical protein C7974DRAFT_309446 [Boeremia exigua]|uniref:uncharacterized protein n=1 Tax=Boeremia exigua TaxID=749465 RepID=UPI001E8E2DFC|nr:uncharacterized protein C7974DRAFT_309446 [Boeremia exigua]KAH6633153.1 hypothetical protein C7974DRAFT_309446 [Boeremia exigua]